MLLTNPDAVEDLLLRHIVSGSLTTENIFAQSCLVMRNNVRIPINDDNTVGDNDAHVVTPDVRSANGYLHAVDKVLALPARAVLLTGATPDGASPVRHVRVC